MRSKVEKVKLRALNIALNIKERTITILENTISRMLADIIIDAATAISKYIYRNYIKKYTIHPKIDYLIDQIKSEHKKGG